MTQSDFPQHAVSVGAIRIDWDTLQIVRGDMSVRITPKAAEVLHRLLESRDATVSRRQLFDAVWPASASADEVLTQVINELRRAFEDDAKNARYIATIPKRGYRWIGPAPKSPTDVAARMAGVEVPTATPSLPPPRRWPPSRIAIAMASATAIAGMLILAWQWGSPSASIDVNDHIADLRVRPLTAEPGLDLDPAVSSDGTKLIYTHVQNGLSELRARVIGAEAYTTIPLEPGGTPSSPAWSPDGRELVFVWRQESRCEVRRIGVDGTLRNTLDALCPTTVPSSLDWSADGRFIVFSRSDAQADVLGRRNTAIYRVAPDGRDLQRLSNSQRWLSSDLHPRISRDSREVAFIRDADGRHSVVSLTADGSSTERETAVEMWPYRVTWGHTPGTLLVAGHGRAAAEIQRVDINTGTATMLVAESAGPGLTLTPDGKRLIFERRSIDDNIWSVPDTDISTTAQRVTDEMRSQLCPRISPDGKLLAYLSDESGNMEVVRRSLDTGEHSRMSAFAPDVPVDLAWSPSGDFIAVVLGTARGKHLAILDADGKRLPIPDSLGTLDIVLLDWSYDEAWLYLVVPVGGRLELHRMNFPDFSVNELVTDQSIAALSASRSDAGIHLVQARSRQLEWLGPHSAAPEPLPITLQADPADQWLVHNETLAEMHQAERGGSATLRLSSLTPGSSTSSLVINAPDPPLGRNIDLGARRLWYANRDSDEADLVEMEMLTGSSRR